MARYRILNPRGAHDTQAPAHDISPSDYTEWAAYIAWLAAGNVPDPASPPSPLYASLAAQRGEMLARLDGLLADKQRRATFVAAGHTWKLTPAFLGVLILSRITTPPMPPGFALPDVNRVQVPLNTAQLSQVCDGARTMLLAIGSVYAAFVVTINASPTPFTINIEAGWP